MALVGGGPSGVEKTRGSKARSLLNSKVEFSLDVENSEKLFLGSSNSIVVNWANYKLFSLVFQLLRYPVPAFFPSILTKLLEPSAHPKSLIGLAIHSSSMYRVLTVYKILFWGGVLMPK